MAKKCTTRTNYGKVLGVRAQAITGTRINCPSLNLVLKKKKKKYPSLQLLERSQGRERGLLIACPSLDLQDLRAQAKNGIWLVGEQSGRGSHTVPCVGESNPGLELQPQGQNSISSF